MNIKYYFIPFILVLLFVSCGEKKVQGLSNDRSYYKSAQSLSSCRAIKLPADIDFNGHFLYHFVNCFSNKLPDGTESMGSLLTVTRKFGVSGLDNMTELLKYSTRDKINGVNYPLLRSLTTFINFGPTNPNLKELLLDFDPSFVLNLLFAARENHELEKVLNLGGDLLNKVDPDIFFGFLRSFLENEESRQITLKTIDEIINNDELWPTLTEILEIEKSNELSAQSQQDHLDAWLVTYSKTQSISSCEREITLEQKDGVERFDNFLEALNLEEKDRLIGLTGDFFKEVLETEGDGRLSKLKRIKNGMRNLLNEQKNPLLNITGILSLIKNTKASELTHLIKAASALIEDPYLPALASANVKVGTTILQEKIKGLLMDGGVVSGCNNMHFNGVKEIKNEKEFFEQIRSLFVPQEECLYQLPPVVLYTIRELNNYNQCATDQNLEYCITSADLQKLSLNFQEDVSDEMLSVIEPDSNILKAFVLAALDDVKNGLIKSPNYLRFKHLAYGKVEISLIDKLVQKISSYVDFNITAMAELDVKLSNDIAYARILVGDFLEKVVAVKLDKLKMTSYEFNNLLDDGTDKRFSRVLLGIYNEGPFEQVIDNEMTYEKWQKRTDNLHADEYQVRELLSRFKEAGSYFHNYELEVQDEDIDFKLIGSSKRGMKFKKDGSFSFTRQSPFELREIFGKKIYRANLMLQNRDMLGKDAPVSIADSFSRWAYEDFKELINDSDYLKLVIKNSSFKSLDTRFLDIKPYSYRELRKIALFNSMNYLAVPAFLPRGNSNQFEIYQGKDIRRQFLGHHSMKNNEWTTFNKYYSNILNYDEEINFSMIRERIHSQIQKDDYLDLFGNGPFEYKLNDKTQIYEIQNLSENELEIYGLLAGLNLLTQNKKKEMMPMLSLGENCWDKKGKRTKCAINFIQNESVEGFTNLKDYIADFYLMSLCPYLDKDQVNFDLKITLDREEDRAFCKNLENNYMTQNEGFDVDERYPYKLRKVILEDIIRLGKSNKLKTGLNSLISQLRYKKSILKNYDQNIKLNYLVKSPASTTSLMSVYSLKFNGDHKGFNSFKNGFLNTYLFYLTSSLNKITPVRAVEKAMSRYGANVKPGQNPEKGQVYDFAYDILINTHKKYEKQGTVLDWLVDVVYELSKYPKHLELLTQLITGPEDIETMNMFKNLIGWFIERIREVMGEDPELKEFSWSNPGNKVFKQLLKQVSWWMISDLLNELTISELQSLLESGIRVFTKESESLGMTQSLAGKIITLLEDNVLAFKKDQESGAFVGEILENNIIKIVNVKNSDLILSIFNSLLEELNKDHTDFKGNLAPRFIQNIDDFGHWVIDSAPTLLKTYQTLVNEDSRLSRHENYLQKTINSLFKVFASDPRDMRKGKELSKFLQNKDLGSFESVIWPILFRQGRNSYQYKLLKFIDSCNQINAEVFKSSIVVIDQLLNSSKIILKYITSRINWERDASIDTINAIKTITKLSDFNNGMWEAQADLLNIWIEKGIVYRDGRLVE